MSRIKRFFNAPTSRWRNVEAGEKSSPVGPRSYAAGQIRQDYGQSRREVWRGAESDLLSPPPFHPPRREAPTSIGAETGCGG